MADVLRLEQRRRLLVQEQPAALGRGVGARVEVQRHTRRCIVAVLLALDRVVGVRVGGHCADGLLVSELPPLDLAHL